MARNASHGWSSAVVVRVADALVRGCTASTAAYGLGHGSRPYP
jgi:hypothetical protein